ncbi:hydroxyacid dehydrogenase [Marivivens niveibacter]|uniref:Hydroxyacid dehydrogenase n=1 Tax=Marivivens niveibacter TaxID=1930667 RepID=A0A251WY80_9RHOB|nr:FAD-binding oxidoreductase [Marivivens niveibacter]OUD08903.1 hydroxyacid dehydrogenase [Marivivens niveibacter]
MLNSATPDVVAALSAALPSLRFIDDNAKYLEEPRGRYVGQGVVVAPADTAEVAAVVKFCSENALAVVPYAGGTGLVGGQIMEDGIVPIVLSMERMTQIRDVFPSENVLVCDAGCILADVQNAAAEVDRLFPLSLASEGSARIGGLLATNAGGLNVLRYGNARAQVLGLEVVTAQGEVLNGLTRLRKDNTGYDLRDLMIGSEGSLGIITAAALKLVPQPSAEGTAMMVVPSPIAALDLLSMAQSRIGEGISAFELIGRQGLEFLDEVGPDVVKPFETHPDWCVLIDLGLPAGLDPQAALENLFVEASEAGIVTDGVIAQSQQQRHDFWNIRESIPAANKRIGSVSSHDISVPLSKIADYIVEGRNNLANIADFRVNCFGHLGDGNLHFNVFPAKGKSRSDYEHLRGDVKKCVHDLVHKYNGSVSAEHGVGRLKVEDLERYSDPVKLQMMRAIKDALDPKGIMNPGAVLRAR